MEHFEEVLANLRSDCETIILGDFNICSLQRASGIHRSYANNLKLFNLGQIINEPTRITNSSKSLLDHILCNNKEKICQSGTISIGLSDHFLIYYTRKISKIQIKEHKYAKIRSIKNYTKENFIFRLTNADWSEYFNACDVNIAWTAFRDIFMSVLNSVVPVKEVRLKLRTEPWIASEILELIRLRDLYLYQFKKGKEKDNYKLYCHFRNKVQRE